MKWKHFCFCGCFFALIGLVSESGAVFAARLSDSDLSEIKKIHENNRVQEKNAVSLQKYLKKNPNSMKPRSDAYWNLAWYARLADAGDPDSQYIIAKAYENGENVDQNPRKAVAFYQKACDNKHAESCMRLGEIYLENKILQKDSEKALYWFAKAGKLNYTPAQFKVASLYAEQENFNAARRWEEQALKSIFPNEKKLTDRSPRLAVYQQLEARREAARKRGVVRDWRHEGNWLDLTGVRLK